jgi:hypothetical protein
MTANDDDGILIQPGDEGWRELCEASLINGARATKAQMEARRIALWGLTCNIAPCTVRQVFYQATVHGIAPKTEAGYDAVQRCLVELRMEWNMPFNWIVDNTRWMRKRQSFTSIEQAVQRTAQTYRRALWAEANCYIEIWLEKDALAGVIFPVTDEFDVPLMVARGYSSITFLKGAAETIEDMQRPAYVYHFGDWDPSGQNAADKIGETLQALAPAADITFNKVAIQEEQIELFNLPSRPTKQSDSRAKNWTGDSVELDAMHPDVLRRIVRQVIEQHVDQHKLVILRAAEASEREWLRAWRPGEKPATGLNGAGGRRRHDDTSPPPGSCRSRADQPSAHGGARATKASSREWAKPASPRAERRKRNVEAEGKASGK